ncbi:hypothetical protein D3C81_1731630 [compost metagenome]
MPPSSRPVKLAPSVSVIRSFTAVLLKVFSGVSKAMGTVLGAVRNALSRSSAISLWLVSDDSAASIIAGESATSEGC